MRRSWSTTTCDASSLNLLVANRQVGHPPGYAERDCCLVSYSMPLCAHCFVLCHAPPGDPQAAAVGRDPEVMGFFMAQAHVLSERCVGNPHSFVAIHSGGFVRKRRNLHLHVFVVRRRWHKAWLYSLLAATHAASAVRRGVLALFGGHRPAGRVAGASHDGG